ncbi:hypothetical protein BG842_03840 [Haladaptatus sp. W1]|uniref:flippase n=1 Tax=Haladaptatus sp. W1 TaxID=1897478 RepID=UPI000849E4E5|nr:flippase [Haladaptatus sp. W1]ODR80566.1 hypothetical protein BG842_03840 [Haladaptatus sp. W1]
MGENDQSGTVVSKLFTSGSILFVGLACDYGLLFGNKILMARTLSNEGYGAIAFGYSFFAIVSTLSLLGLNSGIARYLPRYESETQQKDIFISAVQIVMPVAVLTGLGIFIFANQIAVAVFDRPAAAGVIGIFALAIPFEVLLKISMSVFQGTKNYTFKAIVDNIGLSLIRVFFVVCALWLGYTEYGASVAYLLSYILTALAGVYLLYSKTNFTRWDRYTPRRKELFLFSFPLMLSSVITIVLSNMDTMLIGYYIGLETVGTYNVVYSLTFLLTVVLTAFRFIVVPELSEHHSNGDITKMRSTYKKITLWIMLVTFPPFFVLIASPELAISLTFGGKYASGSAALVVLSFGFFIHAILGPNAATLTSLGNTKTILFDNVVAVAINLVLNVLLIPRYGMLGAAVATTVSYICLNIAYAVQLYSKIALLPISTAYSRTYLTLLGSGVILLVSREILPIPAVLALFTLVYALTVGKLVPLSELVTIIRDQRSNLN